MKSSDISKSVFMRNILKVKYNSNNIPDENKKEIEYHDLARLQKREENGMYVHIYIPIEHPIVKAALIKRGRIIEWQEHDTKYRHAISVIKADIINEKEFTTEFSAEANVINTIKYDGSSYYRIVGLYINDEPIIRLQGYSYKRKEYSY
jgi:hypothetical protein